MMLALTCVAGVALDALLGEPRRWHPLVGFGNLAQRLEQRFNFAGHGWRSHGVTAWLMAVVPPVLILTLLSWLPLIGGVVEVLVLYWALGLRSLGEHLLPVAQALRAGDLERARERVGRLVSRHTEALDGTGVAKAATESALENGSDAVFAALFWFVVGGVPGVVMYRLANTLDAMWGYRNERFERFGWAAARIDDVLNLMPARLVALTYAVLGKTRLAWRCWRQQGRLWDSPNAGPVMAAGAGALGVELGGPAMYHGEVHHRPVLGEGPVADASSIENAWGLVQRGVWLWLLIICVGGQFYA
ncbi:cobalamin biosynthesis protein [Pseudomonas sp. hsmgli-8]|uniref:Cobalamin biosynthesis protein CobD n=2 Tax=Pseudomonas TaxID=286 RepID=A0ABX0YFS6_9PSED|nr:adenosylcobinamide-phosphate synthase CbiB [Pseudomonas sp. LY10J]MBF7142516.1 cobalamin biosynthesis protein [Pseudomonas sp. LY10J]NJP01054.1 cobalamin biosynthesis protein [Pseudomonas quercus]